MENDVKNVPDNILIDSSSLLTDWLLKYHLDNISYLSAPQTLHLTKGTRKAGIYDSKDVIRPTVQLFKNIKSKNKKGDGLPAITPRFKPRLYQAVSPSKDVNRVFSHKAKGEDIVNAYKKVFTHARERHDKLGGSKIETAVALYRQKEQEKDLAAKTASEKGKKGETVDKTKRKNTEKTKVKIIQNKVTNETEELPLKQEFTEAEQISVKPQVTLKESQIDNIGQGINGAEKNEDIKNSDSIKETSGNDDDKLNKESQGDGVQQGVNIIIVDRVDSLRSMVRSKKIDQSQSKRLESLRKRSDRSVSNRDASKLNLRLSLIQSLKRKHKPSEITHAKDTIVNTKHNCLMITPAFPEDSEDTDKAADTTEEKVQVDNLLQEYRIKYRNMIKLR